jgi:Zn-dependent M28 family amino/carboxypeptidase
MRMMRRGGGGGKTADIRKLGAAAILQVQNTGTDDAIYKGLASTRSPSDERPINTSPRRRLSIPGLGGMMSGGGAPVITITREIADAILENSGMTIDDLKKTIETSMKPASMELSGTKLTIESTATVKLVKCLNVLGMIEGSDPELKKEVVVLGAHMDHLGHFDNYIYNGADDNGSGSVGVLTAARAFAANPVKPKRSVLFALWTGEEKGLYGSRYYVEHPVFPMDKTAMYFNMDMISRAYDEQSFTRMGRMFEFPGGEDLLKKINLADFLTVSFTTGMDDIVREANQYVGLHLFLRESEPGQASGGSDHASFAPKKVPYVYTMAAMTSDYHQTGDSVDKVAGELFAKACRLTYLVSFAAANR